VGELSAQDYKNTLGHFATGVVVVTATTPDGPAGFTCQTFAALSLDPMLVSFNAITNSSSWPKVRDSGRVAINILSQDQEGVARGFARSGADKFEGVAYVEASNGAPLLEGVIASVEGEILSTTVHGDHELCVVQVTNVVSNGGKPLIYFRGGFDLHN